ncbi:MAG: nitroreductase family protein [Phycisphaerae bacterium]|nr:nitroreductase family protein [Phycisphaerae bacterium]
MTRQGVLEVIQQRSSVRAYESRSVSRDKIERCLEAARLAPSACNAQAWTFITVDDPQLRDKLAPCTADKWLPLNHFTYQAPVHVVMVLEPGKLSAQAGGLIKQRDFRWIDIGIAAEHFCLQAQAEGLGTCMLGWFNERKVQALLHIPKSKTVALIITVGYAGSDSTRPRHRKPFEEVTRWNGYERSSQ